MPLDREITEAPTDKLIEIGSNAAFGDLSAEPWAHFLWLGAVIELNNRGVRLPNVEYGDMAVN